ncbi:MAG TPA: DapH/DapD/GlmU-related protein [Candidatus Competibacteraceae bacterium]|nr:DapH/DapD/GlmU-related protein [Candidatus Competibacteraceae bacterium]HRZ06053.1 DapH/DapD/GlmU-related protein [Candidatus Competibacteraceae bacterium]HSA45421.1 DapH/DapD/GlmU-related protein [Candidatus Competibacteraceae bacterium]
MKASYLDFLLCGGAISVILAGTLGLIMLLLPLSIALTAEYHVLIDFLLALLFYGLLSALFVRLLLRFRPMESGEYAMDSPVFTYWKLLTIVYRLGQGALLPFTPVFVKPVVEALFGARVGANVALGGTIDDPYMVTIGDGAVLGNASLVSGNMLHGGKLTCGPVKIGAGATVGVNSVLLPGTELGENVTLMGGSYVMPGTKIPSGETWRGNPARKWL